MTPQRILGGGVIPFGEDLSSVVAHAWASHTDDLTGCLNREQ
jgi:hypothetical protein